MKQVSTDVLHEIVDKLVRGVHPTKIILFGSHAYGTPTPDSDIDLLVVVSESSQPRYRRAQEAYTYLWGVTAPVELFVVTEHELARMEGDPASLGYRAVREGKVIYERRDA